MQRVVIVAHRSPYPNPIHLVAGDLVTLGETSDEYPGWIRARLADGNEGWAPEEILARRDDGGGLATADYHARELDTTVGETLEIRQELCGWIWARNTRAEEGWVPLKSTTPRVFLRPPCLGDRDPFLRAAIASRPLHHPWIHPPLTPEEFDAYLQRFDHPDFESRLVVLHSGELVGVINLNNIIRGYFQNAFLGFFAFIPHAGRGLMLDGMQLVIEEAFGPLDLHRLEANVQPANQRSLRLVQRAGFAKEGLSPNFLHIDGEWRDHERWALLKEDG